MRAKRVAMGLVVLGVMALIGGAVAMIAVLDPDWSPVGPIGEAETTRPRRSSGIGSWDAAAGATTAVTTASTPDGTDRTGATADGTDGDAETAGRSGDSAGRNTADAADGTAGRVDVNRNANANDAPPARPNRRNNRQSRPPTPYVSDGSTFRRYNVPTELLSRQPQRLRNHDLTRPLDTDPHAPKGLLGNYFDTQLHPQTGKAELAPPPMWGSFPRLFSRLDPTINFANSAQFGVNTADGSFMTLWDGFLAVPEPGVYAFFVGHDGDIRVFVNEQQVFSDNDSGIYLELYFTIDLTVGEFPLQITYFHKKGNAQVRLRYFSPGELATLQAVGKFEQGPLSHVTQVGDVPLLLATFYYGSPDHVDVLMAANPDIIEYEDQILDGGLTLAVPPLPNDRVPKDPRIVPAEMLRPALHAAGTLPPEILALSPAKAEIGEQIEILGENFGPFFDEVRVEFAGQRATILQGTPERLLVEVPIGAETGPVVVHQAGMRSNAPTFTVTTVFGLLASFYDMSAETAGFIPHGMRPADDAHVTTAITFGSRAAIDSPFRNKPLGVRFEGELGIPTTGSYEFVLSADEFARVTLDGLVVVERPVGAAAGPVSATKWLAMGRIPVVIEWIDMSGPAHLDLHMRRLDGDEPDATAWRLRPALVFPPQMPSQPPSIVNVSLPSDYGPAEGETFTLTVAGVNPAHGIVEAFIDGLPAVATVLVPTDSGDPGEGGAATVVVTVTVPVGVGHGRVTVRHGYLTSQPVTIALRDVGLFGVYYDFPEENLETGWPPGFPDERPISFMRQDPAIFLEGAGDFNLPFVPETFGVVWKGFIRIDTPGEYKFILGADDGQMLVINGQVLIDDGSRHYYTEHEATVELTAGLHPIEIRFWENLRHEVIKLFWVPPGGAREKVPRRVLRMPHDWTTQYEAWVAAQHHTPHPPDTGE